MSRNGAGAYNLPAGNPVVTGTVISSTTMNSTLSDIATALTASIANDGQTVPLGNLQMGGFKLTGLAAATIAGDAVRYEQLVLKANAGANSDITSMTGLTAPTVAANPARAGDVQTQNYTRFTAGGTSDAITGTLSPAIAAYVAGLRVTTTAAANTVTGPTLNLNGLGAKTIKKKDASASKVALAVGDYNASGPFNFEYDGTDFVLLDPLPGSAFTPSTGQVRQTVSGGPVTSGGFPNLAGATGSTSVTTSNISSTTPLTVTASNGYSATTGAPVDRFGFSTTNLTWSGLSTNGTMYLYVDVAANGTLSTGSTTLSPIYQFGGTRSITNNQFQYNVSEGYASVGNGASAIQTYRVFVGDVIVAAGVVSVINWYCYNGLFQSGDTAWPAAATAAAFNHNLGLTFGLVASVQAVCITAELGYAIGDVVDPKTLPAAGYTTPLCVWKRYTTAGFTTGANASLWLIHNTTGVDTMATVGNWKYRTTVKRGW